MSYCAQCACFGSENEDCGCDCHFEAVLRCVFKDDSGQQCANVATLVLDDKWYCDTHKEGKIKNREPGPEWEEFLK